MEPLTGKIFEELLEKGYTNDFSNLAVVAAHGISQGDFDTMVNNYFNQTPNPTPKTISIADLNPLSLNGDTHCYEFSFGNANNNSDISWSVVKWEDAQNGTRISVDALRGLLKWWSIDSIAVTKASDDEGDIVIYSAMNGSSLISNMDRCRTRP